MSNRSTAQSSVRLGKIVCIGTAREDRWELFTCRKSSEGKWIYDPVALHVGTAVDAVTQMYALYLRAHPELAQK